MADHLETVSELGDEQPRQSDSALRRSVRRRCDERPTKLPRVALIVLGILALSSGGVRSALAQANGADINEATTGAIYVNPQSAGASDSNPGTSALPLRTISRAVDLALARRGRNLGTRIEIYPSIYRES